MTKVLITGTNSFIGRSFRRFSKYKDTEEISLFVNEPEDIDFSGYDTILHLAAIVHQTRKIADAEYFRVNRDLCLRVADQAKKSGVRHFIFMSTIKVYHESVVESGIRNEDSMCCPEDAYGRSKYEAEVRLKELRDNNFKVSIIRSSLVYGEGVKANMLSMIKLVDKCPILPFKNIDNKRNFVYIENLIGYIDRVIELKASGTFIAIDPESISTSVLVNYISKFLGKKVILFALPWFVLRLMSFFLPGIIRRLFYSLEFENSETLRALDFSVPFTTEEGIRRTINSYKSLSR